MTISLEAVTVDTKSANGAIDRILQRISLVIGQGTYLGILGRNGEGKTTLARLLSGLERPTSGKVLRHPSNLRVMQVVQRPEDLFTEATVVQQIISFLPGSPDIKQALNIMDQANLDRERQHSPITQLSSGEQRLVAIACALATKPDCIVLDEPMVGLDNNNRVMVRNVLRQLKASRSISLCLISHYTDDFIGLVDRLCILHETQIIYDGSLAECPVTLLDLCLDVQDASVYHWLQAQAANGIIIPPQLYEDFTQPDLQAVLDRITL